MRRSKAEVERYIASVQGLAPSPREVSGFWGDGWPPPRPGRGLAWRRRHGSRRPPLLGMFCRGAGQLVWSGGRSGAREGDRVRGGRARPRRAAVGASASSFLSLARSRLPSPEGPSSPGVSRPRRCGLVPGAWTAAISGWVLSVSWTVSRRGGGGTFQASSLVKPSGD